MLRYVDQRGAPPNVNRRLTNVINDMGAQWNRDRANVNNPARQVTVGGFWSEWAKDYYPWLISHTTTWAENTIRAMSEFWGPRTGEQARVVLENLRNLEAQLVGLTLDTSGINSQSSVYKAM